MSQSHESNLGTPPTPVPPDATGEAIGTATYSPEDNKLRLYPFTRLDRATYERVKAAGFAWAAKQELFVAPKWTPERVDLLCELCGEIEDEDRSLAERAEERAERFGDYRERRAADAEAAHAVIERITSGIPLGQPILVGHHSERHARRDQKRIESGMRKAVQSWETAQYWRARAAGVIRHANYKDRADVRARRIKGLEADLRKAERDLKTCETLLALWGQLDGPAKDGAPVTDELRRNRALWIANRSHLSACFPIAEYPRPEGASQYEGAMSMWSALDQRICSPERVRDLSVPVHERGRARHLRWIEHLRNRIAYEREILEAQGAGELLQPKPRRVGKAALPLCNYRAPEGIACENMYHRGELVHHPQVEMTREQYAKIHKDYRGTRTVGGSHRVRTAMRGGGLVSVFLTDSKIQERPADGAPQERPLPARGCEAPMTRRASEPSEADRRFAALRGQLQQGVQVAVAPSLFPTPEPLAARMVELAEIRFADRVLEPSAGTGRLLDAVWAAGAVPVAVELDVRLVERLRARFKDVRQGDFLECAAELGTFDAVVMNPPFEGAQDVLHILRAFECLRPDGRLVAICADGPRQQARLRPFVEQHGGSWEPLPAATFQTAGTAVRTVLLWVRKTESRAHPVDSSRG